MSADRPVAWVTGGTRGLGQAVAQVLSATYDLALSYRTDERHAALTRESVQAAGGREPLLLRGDLSREGVADTQTAHILDRFGRLDALVHCAALAAFKPVVELRPRELRRILAYSFEAFHGVVLAAVKPISTARGSIVAVSSLGARRAIPGYAGLGAAKAALESYARYLALEMGPSGVRVNVVVPGILRTASLAWLGVDKASLAEIEARTPLARLVAKEEVAQVVAFLLSRAASAITGQLITIDGGYEILA